MLQWILKKVKARRVSAAQAEARRLVKYVDQLLPSTDKLTDPYLLGASTCTQRPAASDITPERIVS